MENQIVMELEKQKKELEEELNKSSSSSSFSLSEECIEDKSPLNKNRRNTLRNISLPRKSTLK
jgi:hypothetical protein